MNVSVDGDGFVVDDKAVAWSAVRAIVTYKGDLWAYDDVCLAFGVADDVWVEVSEAAAGFTALVTEMERRYPAIVRDWRGVVTMTAFAENYRVLWRKA